MTTSPSRPLPEDAPARQDAAAYHRPHYQMGIPALIEVPDTPLTELLDTAAAFYPQRVALDFLGATLTYAELREASLRAAGLLWEAGVRWGDRVALLMPNCPQHVVAVYGALRLGAVVAEHNPLAPAEELRAQLESHQARVLVAWEKGFEALAALGDPTAERTVLTVDLSAAMPPHLRAALRLPVDRARRQRSAFKAAALPATVRSWDREVARHAPVTASAPLPQADDVAVLLYTGGTTGTPTKKV